MRRLAGELLRYVLVGATATAVHFATLTAGVRLLEIRPIGVANFIAAIAGSTCAFIGNRYFVFPGAALPMRAQFARFAALYLAAALFHGSFLYVWSDRVGLDYRAGFVLATAIQVVAVYLGNRTMVFR